MFKRFVHKKYIWKNHILKVGMQKENSGPGKEQQSLVLNNHEEIWYPKLEVPQACKEDTINKLLYKHIMKKH